MAKTSRIILLLIPSLLSAGCVAREPISIKSDDPDLKIPAIKIAVQKHNKSAIPQLVHDLNSDDPAVRFYAIDGLHSLTGQTLGYRYFDDEEERKPALQRWNEWLAAQRVASR
jgi:hypothetical protein